MVRTLPCRLGMFCAVFASGMIARGATVYRLWPESTYTVGCYGPCACPLATMGVGGTFELSFVGFDGLYYHYAADNVQWTAAPGTWDISLTGSGTYRVGGEFASMHQMQLDLTISSDGDQHFDSTLVAGGGNFPTIDIVVSVSQMFCFDHVVAMHANPLGDLDDDGDVDAADTDIFVSVLLGTDTNPNHRMLADVNLDGSANGDDIGQFTTALLGG